MTILVIFRLLLVSCLVVSAAATSRTQPQVTEPVDPTVALVGALVTSGIIVGGIGIARLCGASWNSILLFSWITALLVNGPTTCQYNCYYLGATVNHAAAAHGLTSASLHQVAATTYGIAATKTTAGGAFAHAALAAHLSIPPATIFSVVGYGLYCTRSEWQPYVEPIVKYLGKEIAALVPENVKQAGRNALNKAVNAITRIDGFWRGRSNAATLELTGGILGSIDGTFGSLYGNDTECLDSVSIFVKPENSSRWTFSLASEYLKPKLLWMMQGLPVDILVAGCNRAANGKPQWTPSERVQGLLTVTVICKIEKVNFLDLNNESTKGKFIVCYRDNTVVDLEVNGAANDELRNRSILAIREAVFDRIHDYLHQHVRSDTWLIQNWWRLPKTRIVKSGIIPTTQEDMTVWQLKTLKSSMKIIKTTLFDDVWMGNSSFQTIGDTHVNFRPAWSTLPSLVTTEKMRRVQKIDMWLTDNQREFNMKKCDVRHILTYYDISNISVHNQSFSVEFSNASHSCLDVKERLNHIENQVLRITRDDSTRYEELLVDLEAKCEILNIESVPQLNCTNVDLDYGPSRRLSWNNEESFNTIERFRVRLEYILKQSLNNIHIPNAETLQAHHEFRKVLSILNSGVSSSMKEPSVVNNAVNKFKIWMKKRVGDPTTARKNAEKLRKQVAELETDAAMLKAQITETGNIKQSVDKMTPEQMQQFLLDEKHSFALSELREQQDEIRRLVAELNCTQTAQQTGLLNCADLDAQDFGATETQLTELNEKLNEIKEGLKHALDEKALSGEKEARMLRALANKKNNKAIKLAS